MLKKTINYTDYNGNPRSEDYYFNLSKTEILEMELGTVGGLAETIQRIVAAEDAPSIMKIFKDLILKAYGERSVDGRGFLKMDEEGRPLSRKFAQTEAYNVLFMELATDADAAAKFINGIIPADMADEEAQAKAKAFLEQKNR